jgi:chromosome segregation ATPase
MSEEYGSNLTPEQQLIVKRVMGEPDILSPGEYIVMLENSLTRLQNSNKALGESLNDTTGKYYQMQAALGNMQEERDTYIAEVEDLKVELQDCAQVEQRYSELVKQLEQQLLIESNAVKMLGEQVESLKVQLASERLYIKSLEEERDKLREHFDL